MPKRNAAIGIQVSERQGDLLAIRRAAAKSRLEITDTGGAKGFMALAGFAAVEQDKQTDHGYEKTYIRRSHDP